MLRQKYLTDYQVGGRYGVCRATVWGWAKKGILPTPKKVGPNTSRWDSAELDERDAKLESEGSST